MTETAPTSEFSEKSVVAVGATIGGLILVTLICKLASVPQEVLGLVSGTAGLIPGTIAYGVQRRRSRTAVASGAQRGWRPPAPALLAVLYGLAIIIVDSAIGVLFTFGPTQGTVILILGLFLAVVGATSGLLSFLLVSRPFFWIMIAAGIVFALRVFIMILFAGEIAALDTYLYPGAALNTVVGALVGNVLIFAVAVIGVAIATRHRAAFLARKLGATPSAPTAPAVPIAPVAATETTAAAPVVTAVPPGAAAAPVAVAPSTAPPPVPAAGWFPDPELRGIQRWWDGAAWTDQRRNTPE